MSSYDSESIYDPSGKLLKFSFEHFITDIVKGKACFLCGTLPGTKNFNDEHIIPDWLLRKFDLHSLKIKLPNAAPVPYGSFKIPCCQDCNTLLGEIIEKPVSKLFATPPSYNSVIQHIDKEGYDLLFVWLSLIFLKHQLYDSKVRYHLDRRQGSDIMIGDRYPWPLIEHALCVARTPYTHTILTSDTIGSIFICPVKSEDKLFDHMDFYASQAIMIQINDVFIVCVLDDAGYCDALLQGHHSRMKPPLFNTQCREVFAKYAYTSQLIKQRPIFHTDFLSTGKSVRRVETSDAVELNVFVGETYGYFLCEATKRHFISGDVNHIDPALGQQINDYVEAKKKAGNWSYIFHENGAFNGDGVCNLSTIDARFRIT